jgi:catechol 2,3-dioxygenase-like lactoylglutathione lyase family enzyme
LLCLGVPGPVGELSASCAAAALRYRSIVERFEASALTHMLVVTDVERSRDWYRDVLEAQVVGEYGGTSVVLTLLDSWILLVTGGGPDAGKPSVSLAAPSDPDRPSAQLIFRVDNCMGLYELLSGRGAEFLAPPDVRDGETRAFLRDPDGHLFEISELT